MDSKTAVFRGVCGRYDSRNDMVTAVRAAALETPRTLPTAFAAALSITKILNGPHQFFLLEAGFHRDYNRDSYLCLPRVWEKATKLRRLDRNG